jgi:prepilin-type N-terminal cleavage/methylation domain-containing protein
VIKLGDKRGVTLVEIIVSIAILGIIITPLATLFVSSVRNNGNARNRMIANQVAQRYMEKAMSNPIVFKNSITKNPFNDSESGMKVRVDISDNYDFQLDAGGNISYHFSFEASSKDFNNNKLIIENNTIKLGSSTYPVTFDSVLNIEIKCNANMNKILKVINKSGERVNIYKVHSASEGSDVKIVTEYGEVYVYRNIYDKTVVNADKNRVYKIKITVKKGTETLTELASFKTID